MSQGRFDNKPTISLSLSALKTLKNRIYLGTAIFAGCLTLIGWKIGAKRYSVGPLSLLFLVGAICSFVILVRVLSRLTPAVENRGIERSLSWQKLLLLRAGILIISLAICEAALAVFFIKYPVVLRRQQIMRPGDGPHLLGADYFRKFYRETFDADLGWDIPNRPPLGPARRMPVQYSSTLASSYGDSYTAGYGQPDEETWQTHLSAYLGANVVNYGVTGYGTDQALLKLKKFYPQHPTPVVLLGHQTDGIKRIVNVYRHALLVQQNRECFLNDGSSFFAPTKPRFILKDGQLLLLPNPVRSEEDLLRLVFEPGYAAQFSRFDYFKEGYQPSNFCPEVKVPYVFSVLRAVLLKAAPGKPRRDYASVLMQDPESYQLLTAVFDEFAAYGKRVGFRGFVLLFGDKKDLEYYIQQGVHGRIGPLVSFLKGRGYAYIDTIEILATHNKGMSEREDLSLYYDTTNHHSAYAHRIIAAAMAEYLAPDSLVRVHLKPEPQ